MAKVRVLHYLNQFFGGIGGEEQADAPLTLFDGARGPGIALERLAPEIEVVATIAGGDNYVAEHLDRAMEEAVEEAVEEAAEVEPVEADEAVEAPADVPEAVEETKAPALVTGMIDNPSEDDDAAQIEAAVSPDDK